MMKKILLKGRVADIASNNSSFTVIPFGKTNSVRVEMPNYSDFTLHCQTGDKVEIIGHCYTKKIAMDNGIKCVDVIKAQSISYSV